MSDSSKSCRDRVTRRLVSLALVILPAFVLPSRAGAGDIPVIAGLGGTFRITVAGIAEEVDGPLAPGAQPPGANFTIVAGKKPGFVIIHSTIANQEPTVLRQVAFAPAQGQDTFTIGVIPTLPGESGSESLIFTGSSTEQSLGGSTIAVSILGGSEAAYTTLPGDTFSDVYSHLVTALDAEGVDAYQSGTSLVVISTVSDATTLAGAVEFTSSDPTLSFGVMAATVPEPASLVLLGLGLACLCVYIFIRKIYTRRNGLGLKPVSVLFSSQ